MFCKVCHDAGKKDFKSHFVRDGGKVVCPTLLSQSCKYCKKPGHTRSYCPVLSKKNKSASAPLPKPTTAPTAAERKELSDRLKEQARELCSSPTERGPIAFTSLTENFPIIGQTNSGNIVRPMPMKLNAWASVVGREAAKAPAPQAEEEAQAPAPAAQAPAAQAPAAQAPAAQAPAAQAPAVVEETRYIPAKLSKCWADEDY